MPLKMARRPRKSALLGQWCLLTLVFTSKVSCSSGITTRSQFDDDQTVPTTDSSLNVQEQNSDQFFDYGAGPRSSVEAIKATASNLLHSYEDPINHSLEGQYGTSTENSVPGWREYGSAPQGSKFERYQREQGPLITSDGQVETSTVGTQRGMMGDPAQLPAQLPSQLPAQMPTPSAMVQTTTMQQQQQQVLGHQQQQYPERRLGTPGPAPMQIGAAPMASERIFSFGRSSKKKQRSEPAPFAPIPVSPVFAPMPMPMIYPHQPAAAMVPIQMVAAPQNLQPVRQKRRPQRNGGKRPSRGGSRWFGGGGKKKPKGKKPGGPQPYGLGSMNLPTYSPAFVSYGPIFGPPPGIQLKHPVHAHQGYGTPTQQSMTYVPLVQHGPNGVIQPSYNPHGSQMMYSPHGHHGPSGPQGPMPILQQGPHGRGGFDSDRTPAFTISVEAPSNSYASAPMNIDGSYVRSGANTGPSYSSGFPAVGPHPVPSFGMSVMSNSGFGPSRPLPAPPGVNTGPSYLSNPLPVPSSAPMRYLPVPAQSKPSHTYNSQPPHGSSSHQSSYNPPMHFGPPMHNFGPPMSSLGQPPPIMGEPHIDKWAPPTGYHSYPGNSGYTSHEYSTGPSSYNSQPTSKYTPSQDFGSASTGSYNKGKYKDFKASIEDPNISHESKYSSSYPSYSGNSNSNYNAADYSNNDYSYTSRRKKKQRQQDAAAKPYDDFSSGYNSYDTFKATAPAATVAPDVGFPEDDFFTSKGSQKSTAPRSRYQYKRRRNSNTASAYDSSYDGNNNNADSYGAKPASSYSDTSSASGRGQSEYTGRSANSYGDSKSRPAPYYDTHYNSPGMSKDQKVTDWYDYADRTKDQKLKLGYPKGYRRKVLRYRTLPDSFKTYNPDPNHRKYPKLTYDTKHKRLSSSGNDKAAKYHTEETKMAVYKTAPLGGAQRVY